MLSTLVTPRSAHDPEMFTFTLQKGKNSQLFQYFFFLQDTGELKKPEGKDK